jgi:hypothetical protein
MVEGRERKEQSRDWDVDQSVARLTLDPRRDTISPRICGTRFLFPRDAFPIDESKAPVTIRATSISTVTLHGTRRVPADAGVCESSAVSRGDSARRVRSRSRNTISESSQGEFLKLDERRMLIFYFALISRPPPFISRPRRRPAPAVDTPD